MSLSLQNRIKKIARYAALIFFVYIFLFPMVFMIVASLKGNEIQIVKDMSSIKAFLPYGEIGLRNYFDILDRMNIGRFMFNSVFITLTTVTIGVVFNSMLAFALARMEFKFKKIILSLVIALIIVPIESIIIPMLLIVNEMGIVDSYTVQILPFIADAFLIFMFYQAFLDLPKALDEAAIVDGASYFRIYWNISMPLIKPTVATAVITNAIARWGDLLWPVMVTRGETYRPLPVAMQQLFTIRPIMWGDVFAFATIITLPVLIMFLIFQKQFVESIASSGVKG